MYMLSYITKTRT
uniref:Uncharacterized protein n=1 Tax=Anguilla anguilla TaxID=7936 RepID=A0A0E9UCB3_ANGAN